jgi:hypothetical protein
MCARYGGLGLTKQASWGDGHSPGEAERDGGRMRECVARFKSSNANNPPEYAICISRLTELCVCPMPE